jgi:hypothetical protein
VGDAAVHPDLWDFCGDAADRNQRLPKARDGFAETKNTDPLRDCVPSAPHLARQAVKL